jgi:uncharacterized protein (DUF362 family)
MTMAGTCTFYSVRDREEDLIPILLGSLPAGSIRRVVIKPNWVIHESDPDFPIRALVTSERLVDAAVSACLRRYPTLESILVADVPIQGCDWTLLARQAGIERLQAKYRTSSRPRVDFRDLRMQRVRVADGFLSAEPGVGDFGDLAGYGDVILDERSFLEPVCGDETSFRVADYSPEEMRSSHRKGFHRYRIARSLLDCDLFINLPKMKTHQKAGITGALKNLVGINGNKATLVHFKAGRPGAGGDEFPPDVAWPVILQSRARQWALGRSVILFRTMQKSWRAFRRLYGIEVRPTRENLDKRFLISGGSWHGNDTIWRMIYDLNRIVLYATPSGGPLEGSPQRRYLAILDGMVGGEGNGPLQPLPVDTGVLGIAEDPFLMDMAASRLMGLDYRKIPQLSHHREFAPGHWGDFDPETVAVSMDGREYRGIAALPILRSFVPPAGWRGHIELEATSRVA